MKLIIVHPGTEGREPYRPSVQVRKAQPVPGGAVVWELWSHKASGASVPVLTPWPDTKHHREHLLRRARAEAIYLESSLSIPVELESVWNNLEGNSEQPQPLTCPHCGETIRLEIKKP
jgi:hypothetical protein